MKNGERSKLKHIFTEPSAGANGDTTTIDHLIDGRSRYEQGEQAMDVTMGSSIARPLHSTLSSLVPSH
jgi:hypothetical protein